MCCLSFVSPGCVGAWGGEVYGCPIRVRFVSIVYVVGISSCCCLWPNVCAVLFLGRVVLGLGGYLVTWSLCSICRGGVVVFVACPWVSDCFG